MSADLNRRHLIFPEISRKYKKLYYEQLSGHVRWKLETMDKQALLDRLLDLAEELGYAVRHEFLGGDGGGLARLRGCWALFVDKSLSVNEQCEQAAEALASHPEMDSVYIFPEVREYLESFMQE